MNTITMLSNKISERKKERKRNRVKSVWAEGIGAKKLQSKRKYLNEITIDENNVIINNNKCFYWRVCASIQFWLFFFRHRHHRKTNVYRCLRFYLFFSLFSFVLEWYPFIVIAFHSMYRCLIYIALFFSLQLTNIFLFPSVFEIGIGAAIPFSSYIILLWLMLIYGNVFLCI